MTHCYFDTFADLYKDAHGVRPTAQICFEFGNLPVERQQEVMDDLERTVEQQIEDDKKSEQEAIQRFEKMVKAIETQMKLGRADAVKQAMRTAGGLDDITSDYVEYVEYTLGLPYGYLKKQL